jgi:hypothetical protein
MLKRRIHVDVWLGLILMGFSAFFLAESTKIIPVRSAQFPRFALGLFFLLAALLFIMGVIKVVKKSDIGDVRVDWKNVVGKAHIVYAMIVAYVVLFILTGFFPATIIFCPCIMLYYGIRKVKILFLVTAILALFVYLLFVVQLRVMLPVGILFGG